MVEVQLRVACPPLATTVGEAVSAAVGAGSDPEPEEPPQLTSKASAGNRM